jgi:hypothetical protein
LSAPSEVTQTIIEFHTDALKTYQKRKGIVLYIFSVLSKKLMSVMDIPSMLHATISFILHYSENTGKQNNECMLHPFLANYMLYIHPFKIMYAFFKYGIQIHYFKDICWSFLIGFWSLCSMWPKVLQHVKKSLYNQPKPYFFNKLLWSHFWIDFNKFYTKTFRIVYILIVYLLIMFIWVVFICS